MIPAEYLDAVLADQALDPDGMDMKKLRGKREQVERLLRVEFESCNPVIRYGGSKAKGTMNRESFDLDLPTYFRCDDVGAGDTLKQIYDSTAVALEKDFLVDRRRSSLRLMDRTGAGGQEFTHLDVVPARFVDETATFAFIHQRDCDKERLKTNLDMHIDLVKASGVRPAIRIQKLWKVRRSLQVKTFVLELLVIDILRDFKSAPLDEQALTVWRWFRDKSDLLSVTDPANPDGNDLSTFLGDTIRFDLRNSAAAALQAVEDNGWEAVFGVVAEKKTAAKAANVQRIAQSASATAVKPWAHG
jgi:hypothetical protein